MGGTTACSVQGSYRGGESWLGKGCPGEGVRGCEAGDCEGLGAYSETGILEDGSAGSVHVIECWEGGVDRDGVSIAVRDAARYPAAVVLKIGEAVAHPIAVYDGRRRNHSPVARYARQDGSFATLRDRLTLETFWPVVRVEGAWAIIPEVAEVGEAEVVAVSACVLEDKVH